MKIMALMLFSAIEPKKFALPEKSLSWMKFSVGMYISGIVSACPCGD
jgi:hypothetical protein